MKTLLFTLLLTLSFTVQAGYRSVYICDSRGNCEYITVFEDEPTYNQHYDEDYERLMENISDSGLQNFNTINSGLNPQE